MHTCPVQQAFWERLHLMAAKPALVMISDRHLRGTCKMLMLQEERFLKSWCTCIERYAGPYPLVDRGTDLLLRWIVSLPHDHGLYGGDLVCHGLCLSQSFTHTETHTGHKLLSPPLPLMKSKFDQSPLLLLQFPHATMHALHTCIGAFVHSVITFIPQSGACGAWPSLTQPP